MDFDTRLKEFQTDLKALLTKHEVGLKPQISPDGPVMTVFDNKKSVIDVPHDVQAV